MVDEYPQLHGEPWHYANQNGRSHRLRFPEQQPLWQLKQPSRNEPRLWTVQTEARWTNTRKVADQRVLVDLNWGNVRTGQGGLTATVDAGQSVVLCAEYLQAVVRTVGTEDAAHGSLDPYVDIVAIVSRGNRSNARPVTYTDVRKPSVDGYAGPWEVPPFTDHVRLLYTYDWTVGVVDTTAFFGTASGVIVGGTITSVQRSGGAGVAPWRADVSRDSRFMLVRCSGATDVQPVWVLQI